MSRCPLCPGPGPGGRAATAETPARARSRDRRHVDSCDVGEIRQGERVALQDQGIMPWDEVISGRSERPHQGEPFEHLLDIDDNGKGSLLLQVGVLVAGVGGENDEAAPRTDANDLEPPGPGAPGNGLRQDALSRPQPLAGLPHVAGVHAPDHRRHVVEGCRVNGWQMQRPVQKLISRSCTWYRACGNGS